MPTKFRSGDLVEVRSATEILATLDENGCVDALPFMPEMLAFAGRRFRVSKRAHKTCDTVNQTGGRSLRDAVHLEDLRCDGAAHGGCKAACLLFWKHAWLKRVDAAAENVRNAAADGGAGTAGAEQTLARHADRATADGKTVYRCQATAMFAATTALHWWDVRQYVEDLASGNTRLGTMLRVWFFHGLHKLMQLGIGYGLWRRIYDELQPRIGGHRYPFEAGNIPLGRPTPSARLDLRPGERVRVKSFAEIRTTLNKAKANRGMRFDPEMVPYCGNVYAVVDRIDRIIDEKTGEMIEIASPSVTLEGVVCRSQFSACRLFCPRAITPYWREIWLERTGDPD